MVNWIERLKIWVSLRILWRIWPKLKFDAIRNFQATEADGVFHLLRGIRDTKSAKEKAILLSHIIEEESHADTFASIYSQESSQLMVRSVFERERLYRQADPLWKLIAYVHVGEDDATLRFREMLRVLENGPLKRALEKIVRDEEGHIGLTHKLAHELGATPGQFRRERLLVRLRRYRTLWLTSGRRITGNFSNLLLGTTYYIAGSLLASAARKKLRQRVVTYDNNRAKNFEIYNNDKMAA